MTVFSCTVPGKPIPQGRARTTKFGTFYPKTSQKHRKVLREEFAYMGICGAPADYATQVQTAGAVAVLIEIAGARADSDLDNHGKMVLDALVDAGVLASDDVRVVRELVVRVVDGEPRTSVTITAIDKEAA